MVTDTELLFNKIVCQRIIGDDRERERGGEGERCI